jgi:cytochrome b subunit of formate dehydrogenase
MLPQGFLGTRADVLMDIVIVSLAAILPILAFSWTKARRGAWRVHKRTQLILGSILAIVVLLFETDLRMAGGIFALTKPSAFAGTVLLNASIWIHVALSISTSIIWLALTIASVRKFGKPPRPGAFSKMHKLWGSIGMIDMALTGISGIELYIIGFAY